MPPTYDMVRPEALDRRRYWVEEIVKISGAFGPDVERASKELADEEAVEGAPAIIDHLRLCGAIPEPYPHDSSEEKLYSKYTDAVVAHALGRLGLQAVVLTERADAADVEAACEEFSLVADAKAFRLSRTAKNQKDFKVQAMDGWRRDKDHALVVAPLYQLPSSSSQIYEQAIARDVCILSFSHLAVLVRLAEEAGTDASLEVLKDVLTTVSTLNPAKSAADYWSAINRAMLSGREVVRRLWRDEKVANIEAIQVAKEEALAYLSRVRTEMLQLSRDEAIAKLLEMSKLDGREATIRAVADNGLLDR